MTQKIHHKRHQGAKTSLLGWLCREDRNNLARVALRTGRSIREEVVIGIQNHIRTVAPETEHPWNVMPKGEKAPRAQKTVPQSTSPAEPPAAPEILRPEEVAIASIAHAGMASAVEIIGAQPVSQPETTTWREVWPELAGRLSDSAGWDEFTRLCGGNLPPGAFLRWDRETQMSWLEEKRPL